MTTTVDILIEGGTIVDGTGAPGAAGAVAVTGDRLRVLRGRDAEPAALAGLAAGRRIDARGLVVAPGFIDLHSHGGLTILAEPRHEPKVRQGVTTEVIGVDGNAYAPFRTQHDLDDFLTLNAGLDGRPDGVAYDWRTVADYLARYDRGVAVNIAYLVGNSALRIAAVGWDEVEATRAQLADQRALLREGARRRSVRPVDRARLSARRLRLHPGAGRPPGRGREARWLLPHPRPVPTR